MIVSSIADLEAVLRGRVSTSRSGAGCAVGAGHRRLMFWNVWYLYANLVATLLLDLCRPHPRLEGLTPREVLNLTHPSIYCLRTPDSSQNQLLSIPGSHATG